MAASQTPRPDLPRRARRARRARRPTGRAAATCILRALGLLALLHQAVESVDANTHALIPVASGRATSASLLATPQRVSWRKKDEYDDYDEGEDYDDDYDYYGTRKKKKPSSAAAAASPIEVNVFNFVRVMVLRLVWGVASMFGLDEPLSEVFNGAFVPPGVDVDDDDLGFDY